MKYIKLNRRGFSLVELIVVIAIMAVLAGVVGGTLINQLNKQKDEISKIEQGNIIRDIRDACITNENLGMPENINYEFMLNMLITDYPDILSFSERGNAGKHKFLLEYDEENKLFSVSFIMAGSGHKGKACVASYNHDTLSQRIEYLDI